MGDHMGDHVGDHMGDHVGDHMIHSLLLWPECYDSIVALGHLSPLQMQ